MVNTSCFQWEAKLFGFKTFPKLLFQDIHNKALKTMYQCITKRSTSISVCVWVLGKQLVWDNYKKQVICNLTASKSEDEAVHDFPTTIESKKTMKPQRKTGVMNIVHHIWFKFQFSYWSIFNPIALTSTHSLQSNYWQACEISKCFHELNSVYVCLS